MAGVWPSILLILYLLGCTACLVDVIVRTYTSLLWLVCVRVTYSIALLSGEARKQETDPGEPQKIAALAALLPPCLGSKCQEPTAAEHTTTKHTDVRTYEREESVWTGVVSRKAVFFIVFTPTRAKERLLTKRGLAEI